MFLAGKCEEILIINTLRCVLLVYLKNAGLIDYYTIFQQTSSGMFGLGNSQTRCVKSYSTAPINDVARLNPMRLARLIWINNRTVTLMLADGSETRFNV